VLQYQTVPHSKEMEHLGASISLGILKALKLKTDSYLLEPSSKGSLVM